MGAGDLGRGGGPGGPRGALPAAPTVDLQMLAMTPDDSRLIVSAVTNRADIWLLEEFEAQPSWLSGWLRR